MAKGLVVGIQNVDYISKRTNQRVLGRQIYYIYPLDEKKGCGNACDSEYVPQSVSIPISVNDEIEFMYNKFGSVADVKIY
jgi:hypothetical protein